MHVPKDWFCGINSYDAAEVLGGAIGVVATVLCWNRADTESFSKLVGGMAVPAVKRMAASLGLLCFSKSWRNPVLWSHYADEHKGICLGLDVPESCLHEVKYVPERLQFEQLVPDEGQLQHLLRTKFKDWRHEAEYGAESLSARPARPTMFTFGHSVAISNSGKWCSGHAAKCRRNISKICSATDSAASSSSRPAPHSRLSTWSRTNEG